MSSAKKSSKIFYIVTESIPWDRDYNGEISSRLFDNKGDLVDYLLTELKRNDCLNDFSDGELKKIADKIIVAGGYVNHHDDYGDAVLLVKKSRPNVITKGKPTKLLDYDVLNRIVDNTPEKRLKRLIKQYIKKYPEDEDEYMVIERELLSFYKGKTNSYDDPEDVIGIMGIKFGLKTNDRKNPVYDRKYKQFLKEVSLILKKKKSK